MESSKRCKILGKLKEKVNKQKIFYKSVDKKNLSSHHVT